MTSRVKTTIFALCLCVIAAAVSFVPAVWSAYVDELNYNATPTAARQSGDCVGELAVIMYHNVVSDDTPSSKYEVTRSQLWEDLDKFYRAGYNVVDTKRLLHCVETGEPLPERALMITFDDGFLSALRYAEPLLAEYGFTAVMAIVGEYTGYGKSNPDAGGENGIYAEWDDIRAADASGVYEWAYHSDRLHAFSASRKGAKQRRGEDDLAYRKMLTADTVALKAQFAKVGIEPCAYAYPFGAYNALSESVLADMGVGITFTCNYGVNRIYRGVAPRLLKRVNRDGNRPLEAALKNFDRT